MKPDDIKPKVSCIMPTANREEFMPFAIDNFLKQTYTNKELIILNDGVNCIGHLIPGISHIKYLRYVNKQCIGVKRNVLCKQAAGSIIVHLDDDDWYANDWIEYQVNILLSTSAHICGLSKLNFYDHRSNKGWLYTYPDGEKPWVAGATMAYQRSFWEKRPFRRLQVGEDNSFVWRNNARVVQHNYIDGFTSLLHTGNTSPKHTQNKLWQEIPADSILPVKRGLITMPVL